MKIYRDDDINYLTCVEELKRIHAPFKKHNKPHTVAVEMYRLWENKSLIWFLLTDEHINVELHGWRHDPYHVMTEEKVYEELKYAKEYWENHARRMLATDELPLFKRITTYCACWNKTSEAVEKACQRLGLNVCTAKNIAWMFHYWSTNPEQVEHYITTR